MPCAICLARKRSPSSSQEITPAFCQALGGGLKIYVFNFLSVKPRRSNPRVEQLPCCEEVSKTVYSQGGITLTRKYVISAVNVSIDVEEFRRNNTFVNGGGGGIEEPLMTMSNISLVRSLLEILHVFINNLYNSWKFHYLEHIPKQNLLSNPFRIFFSFGNF